MKYRLKGNDFSYKDTFTIYRPIGSCPADILRNIPTAVTIIDNKTEY